MKAYQHILLLLFSTLFFASEILCQLSISRNHPELKWQIWQTQHFRIIYHQSIEKIAEQVASIAEQIYVPITSDLGVEPPGKTAIVVTDYLDYSNGLATPLGHYIFLWTQSETKYTTGNRQWLQTLLAHEFTHIVNFWAFREFPGFWRELFALGFVPTWFLEGLAEYEAEPWCAHRDMLLRVVAYHDKMLPYKKMTGFIGADAINARLVYGQGHSLIRYIASRFGHDKIALIIKNYRRLPFSFNLALKNSIGLSEKQLFRVWKKEIQEHYQKILAAHNPSSEMGKKFVTPLPVNFGARWSPDGKMVAVVGLKKYEENVSELYVLDLNSNKFKKIAGPFVNSFFCWSPDGKQLIFSQKHVTPNGADINDLFLWHREKEKITRLTSNERAIDPHFSSDNRSIVFAKNQYAQSNLAILDLLTHQEYMMTDFPEWTEVFTPAWSPNGEKIVFSIFDQQGRDIGIIDKDGSGFVRLTEDPEDDRYPVWSPDGKQIAFISYCNGTANLYRLNLVSGEIFQMTDSPGGVFNPTWLPDGKHIAVIAFEDREKTDIVLVPTENPEISNSPKTKLEGLPFHSLQQPAIDAAPSLLLQTQSHLHSSPYRSFAHFRPQILLPYADENEKGWQFGVVNLAADPLEKHSLLTTITYGKRIHLYFDYVNRQLNPTIELTLNKTTVNQGDFLRVDNQTILPLHENYYSGTIGLYWHINFGRSLLSNHFLWLRQTVSFRNSINYSNYKQNHVPAWALPFQGWVNYLTFGYTWQSHRPDINYDIHPKTGHTFSAYQYLAESWLKSDLSFSQLNISGIFRQEFFADHVFAWRSGGIFHQGSQALQTRLAFGNETIRGLSSSQEGDKQIFFNLEYRFPLIRDLGFKLWLMYFEQFTGAFFFDSSKAWGSYLQTFYNGQKKSFGSADWVKTVGLELRHRFYLLGKQPVVFSAGCGWNVDNLKEANFYWRIGQIF